MFENQAMRLTVWSCWHDLQVVYQGPLGQDAHDAFVLLLDNGSKHEVACHALRPRSKVTHTPFQVSPTLLPGTSSLLTAITV